MVPSEDDRPERTGGSGDAGAAAAGPVVEVLGWSAAPPEATRATAGESRGAGDEPGPGDDAVPDDEAAVGGPDDDVECRRRSGPRLRLDWRRFAYAGKFATPETGVVVVRDPGTSPPALDVDTPPPRSEPPDRGGAVRDAAPDVVAAAAVSPDRTDPPLLRIRYVTVRRDRRGEGLGAGLLAAVAALAGGRGHDRVAIAVNNPYALEAAAKAGFAFTGETTGVAELVCARDAGGPTARVPADGYGAALDALAARDLDDGTAIFLAERRERGPPAPVAVPRVGGEDPVDD